jgi:hypothetical protein
MRFSLSSNVPTTTKPDSTISEGHKNLENQCYLKIREVQEYLHKNFNVKSHGMSNASEFLQKQKLKVIKPMVTRRDDLRDVIKELIQSFEIINNKRYIDKPCKHISKISKCACERKSMNRMKEIAQVNSTH